MNFEPQIRLKREVARMRASCSSSLVTSPSRLVFSRIRSQQVGVSASSSNSTSNFAVQVTLSAPVVSSLTNLVDLA